MKTLYSTIIALFVTITFISAQDTLYVYKSGAVISKCAVNDLDSMSFTYSPPETGTATDIDGNVYHWISIGTQKWMVENLKVTKYCTGESISNVTDATAWRNATFGAWCDYNNNSSNGVKYGHLYNRVAIMDSRKIAPVGWHIPSDDDWNLLQNYLIASGYNYDVTTSGNKIAKSLASQTDWTINSTLGCPGNNLINNNSTGFTGLPGGKRLDTDGTFTGTGSYAYWWSTTRGGAGDTRGRSILNNVVSLNLDMYSSSLPGLSVRCIKD